MATSPVDQALDNFGLEGDATPMRSSIVPTTRGDDKDWWGCTAKDCDYKIRASTQPPRHDKHQNFPMEKLPKAS